MKKSSQRCKKRCGDGQAENKIRWILAIVTAVPAVGLLLWQIAGMIVHLIHLF